ncbi:translation initiation factor eIF3 core subunit c KNAG_0E01250 [Huiozyma naganishii CBS 8797]|uniref:PCI domain-containing protein n=1 Tax=Huiozyma naganishii (strain ATCC MYA-139 / BCRC 22969 / CBS 8797 / KCTC 17520 / NBRC 10181 / NCYC 3082 / Yp74L-3) TaxID=1071383 RepID=J7S7K8_HUIN7|nr:hypothetical protein KNAG_0E01250 [Kazachstania naganishii CBS 8797]CCK70391.1 hypothetical protein KNAG_0E01250 [Kazachstania naganishii CBS 8797]
MSRFFAATVYESDSSSEESDLLSSSSEDDLMLSSSSSSSAGESEGEEDEDHDTFFESDSEQVSDQDDDEDAKPYGPDWFKKAAFRTGAGKSAGANRFLKGSRDSDDDSDGGDGSGMDDDDEDGGKKVVKSAKDKLLDELYSVGDAVDAAVNAGDWAAVSNEFDTANRLLIRTQQQNMRIPNVFVCILAQLEDALTATPQDNAMPKPVARAHNIVKQRVKKTAKEYEEFLKLYRESPEKFTRDLETTEQDLALHDSSSPTPGGTKAINLANLATATSERSFFATLKIVMDSRGKKNAAAQDLIDIIRELLSLTDKPYEIIMAYLSLIPIRFEAAGNLSYQPLDQWANTYEDITKFFDVLEKHIDQYQVSETAVKNENVEQEPEMDASGVKRILGSLFSFVERLDDEWNKSLLNIDPHSSDYLLRLKDEQKIYNLVIRTQVYLAKTGAPAQSLNRALLRRLDHIYYKPTRFIKIVEQHAWEAIEQKGDTSAQKSHYDDAYVFQLVKQLVHDVTKDQHDDAIRTRALLYQIYFVALNEEFQRAKDMLIESHVQARINDFDPTLQILFNRVVVQLGLSAFQSCLIEEAHQVLNELLAASHLREMLGQQSLQRMHSSAAHGPIDATQVVVAPEKQCLPFHQHINLDLIDVVFMTCSLLIEIPQMTAFFSGIKVKRQPFSQKSIRRSLEHHDKSSYQSAPESSRDYVIFAAKAMQQGDWVRCVSYLKAIKTWNLLPNVDEVMNILTKRVKTESLKTYFFTYKRFYSRISVDKLADLFELAPEDVVATLEHTIKELEIAAVAVDSDKRMVVVDRGDEITKLEEVALRLNKEYKINREKYYHR